MSGPQVEQRYQLPSTVVLGASSGGVPAWTPATDYRVNQLAQVNGVAYICRTPHTSGASFSGAGTNWAVLGGAAVAAGLKTSRLVRSMLTNSASAPTITIDGVLASSVRVAPSMTAASNANSTAAAWTAGPIEDYDCAIWYQISANNYRPAGAVTQSGSFNHYHVFDFDGQKFLIQTRGNSTEFRVWVNEQPSPWVTGNPNDGATHYHLVDFGSRAYRRIVVEGASPMNASSSFYFGGIWKLPTDSLYPSTLTKTFRIAHVGDSYAEGTGATHYAGSYSRTLDKLLGTINSFNLSKSGTGFTTQNGVTPAYGDSTRVAELASVLPDVVHASASINDSAATGAAIQTAAAAWIASVQAALPAALIVVSGIIRPATPTAGDLTNHNAVKAACAAANIPFIDTQASPPGAWFYGTGTTSAPTGDGNADYYMSGPPYGFHPAQAGHDAIAYRMAPAFAAALGIAL